jgi:hypothetical protein
MRRIPILFALCIVACGGEDAVDSITTTVDSAGIALTDVTAFDAERLPAWQLEQEPALVIGTAEGAAGHDLFGVSSAARAPDGHIAIADFSQQVRIFDADGRLVGTRGRRGQGPGEFQALSWTSWRGDSLVAYDPSARRLTVFLGDSVVREQTLALPGTPSFPEMIGVLDNGAVVAYPGFDRVFGRGERRDTIPYLLYRSDAAAADTIGRYAGTERFFAQTTDMAMQREVLFGRNAYAAARGGTIAAGASDTLAIDMFDETGALRRRVRLHAAPRAVTRDEAARARADLSANVPAQMRAAYETAMQDLPERASYPASTALHVDAGGAVWVRGSHASGETTVHWLVIAPDGTPAAHVTMPVSLQVLEIGADYVLGRIRSDEGVETVVQYRLGR